MPTDFTLSRIWLLGLCCSALAACQSPPTQVDQYFGLSVQQAQVQQTQNLPMATCAIWRPHSECMGAAQGGHHRSRPDAQQTPWDSDGEIAQSAILRYQESFTSPTNAGTGPSVGSGSLIKR
jgi:hypothetical protein